MAPADAHLQAAIARDDVGVVVEDLLPLLVVHGRQVGLRDGQTHGVRDALAQRPRRHLDALTDDERREMMMTLSDPRFVCVCVGGQPGWYGPG